MAMLDTVGWKAFRLGNLFNIVRGTSRTMRMLDEGDIPVIAAARADQGVAGCYDVKPEYQDAITISCNGVGCGSVFYHDGPFAITGDASVMQEKQQMSRAIKLFIAAVCDSLFSVKYSYAEKCNPVGLAEEMISLPATPDGQPDWAYMDAYMSEVLKKEEVFAEHLASATAEAVADGHKLDTSGWKAFQLCSDLGFVCYHGQRLNKSERLDGDIPFLTAGFENCGVAQFIGNDRDVYHKPITVDMFGNCFFHSVDCAGDDNVYFFVNDVISDLCKLFLATCIMSSTSASFEYSHQFRQNDADVLSVVLPVTVDGQPDWVWMELELI